jgi:hypothetical protein
VLFKSPIGLFRDKNLILSTFRTYSARLVDGITNERELRLVLSNDTRDHIASVNADLYLERAPIFERLLLDKVQNVLSEFS